MNFKSYLDLKQFSLEKNKKEKYFFNFIKDLNHHHLSSSVEFNKINQVFFNKKNEINSIESIPYLPVSIFKNKLLHSVHKNNIYKILKSSGTTGTVPSQIVLDKDTAALQTLTLSKIISHIIGKDRLPMIIIDSKSVLKNRKSFTARGAGILGISIFGKKHTYILDEEFELLKNELKDFSKKYSGQKILIFGFTFMVWKYLAMTDLDFNLDLSNAILIHSGGWKKLHSLKVDNSTFKNTLKNRFKIKPKNVYNFYGMVEQVGSVFLENSEGYLHCPNFSDIIIRDPKDFSVLPHGKEGLIQVLSIIPKSYPGHSLLTEDIGVIMGEDDASNGWKGKYFKILGRAKKAEIRGCSDTFKN